MSAYFIVTGKKPSYTHDEQYILKTNVQHTKIKMLVQTMVVVPSHQDDHLTINIENLRLKFSLHYH